MQVGLGAIRVGMALHRDGVGVLAGHQVNQVGADLIGQPRTNPVTLE